MKKYYVAYSYINKNIGPWPIFDCVDDWDCDKFDVYDCIGWIKKYNQDAKDIVVIFYKEKESES